MIELVKITDEFSLGKYPVTNDEYKKFVDEVGYREPAYWDNDALSKPNHPVVGVSWTDATEFCKWANLRLPTETEWEYACTRYDQLDDYAWFPNNSNGRTHTVGKKLPNEFGLYDMYGNVWEWCKGCALRGGSWGSECDMRGLCCFPLNLTPSFFLASIGFRVARSTL